MRSGDSRVMEADHHHRHRQERPAGAAGHYRHGRGRPRYPDDDRQRSSPWVWMAVILCTLLVIGVIVVGAAVFAVYLIYKPHMPYMVVTNAYLQQLDYSPADGVIRDIQVSAQVLARNTNSKVNASFSSFNIDVKFHGTTLLQLRAETFSVARESAVTLPYSGSSRGAKLDLAGMRAMEEALRSRVVPITLSGKARTRWRMGIFLKVGFWTRLNCPLTFNFPPGAVMPIDHDSCRSRSP
ncbi:hypothetical protein D1007_28856 [Hordeum vulgare]|uniref:Late embryogenesis abundant protein LEA-2 subgroup domain-containing protein n=1 Tax=Hordeum vulgare subsp. vulgare TaxID=112509 RepID=A0A8I6YHQ7_HORVV|nr:uncharacterized protein LOC123410662 [Hordeum vulgare subsp. vulgare]KAE8796149.1 hypothetical protein D1007_28856 [Hordeum vulgare]